MAKRRTDQLIRNVGYRDVVDQYCEDVLDGTVIACRMVVAAVKRYRSDWARQQTPEFPYYFDQASAEKACEFFPKFLCHYKGDFSGQPFKLMPWQVFIVWNLFGWKKESGRRRFSQAFILIARKNGKTILCAGLSLLLAMADDEAGAEVYATATKIEQANIIFGDALQMLSASPALARNCVIRRNNLGFPKNKSIIRPIGSDRPFSGLNPHGVIFDELHEWQEHHRKFFNTMTTGSVARTQPMFVFITTASDNTGRIYSERSDYVRDILNGTVVDDQTFGALYEIDPDDSPHDENAWIKANPNWGVSVVPEKFREQYRMMSAIPTEFVNFIRFHCNRNVSSVVTGFDEQFWDSITGPLSDWSLADAIGAGVDLGGWDDLAAFALCARFRIGEDDKGVPLYRFEAKTWSFMSSATRRDLSRQPFAQWILDGDVKAETHVVTALIEHLIAKCREYCVTDVAFDPRNAQQPAEVLSLDGFNAILMPQNHTQFTEPIDSMTNAMKEGRFMPDIGDRVLRWAAIHSAFNVRGQLKMFDKGESKVKIDPLVAMTMAFRAVRAAPARVQGSLYIT